MNNLHVAQLLIQETGCYGQQYSRPYKAVTDQRTLDNLSNRITDVSRGSPTAKVTGGLISGLCGGLMMPSANWDSQLIIPNGWNERRLRFVLEVRNVTGFGEDIYFFQGYSEYMGISHLNTIDDRMVFYINSFMRVSRSRDYSGMSSAGFRDIVSETAQVINGRYHVQSTGEVFGLRPEDLFIGAQSNHISEALMTSNEGHVVDTRLNQAGEVFRSRRTNAIPSNFLSRVIDSYRSANMMADFGTGTDDIYSRAIQSSHEPSPFENPFIRALSDLQGMHAVTTFSMRDLLTLDPNVQHNTQFLELASTVRLHQVGETEDWAAANLKTQLATVVTNAVSGLMVECMMVEVAFHCTNMTLNGMPDTRFLSTPVGFTAANPMMYSMNFINRFESEVLPDLTQAGHIPVSITVHADLYGETMVEISIDGDMATPYTTPSFCDALLSPVVTTNSGDYHALVNGVESIVNTTGQTNYAPTLGLGGIDFNV